MKPLHLALVALSLTAAVAHAAGTGRRRTATGEPRRSREAAGRVDRSQSKQEDPNACVGPVSFCNIYFGS